MAGIGEVSVIVRDLSDEEALAVALIENIQRDDLGPLEEAAAYTRLAEDFGKTQNQIAAAVGKSRSHVANLMRLLELPDEVQDMLSDGRLTMGHARAILVSHDPVALARRVHDGNLSVRATERLAKKIETEDTRRQNRTENKDADTRALEKRIENALGLRTTISFDGTGGKVSLRYESLKQLDDLVDRLIDPP